MPDQSLVPQPEHPFSNAEYCAFVHQYEHVRMIPLQRGVLRSAQLLGMQSSYRAQLPRYMLARCPFCQEPVWEAVDTYSLKGCGWQYRNWTGYGWYGALDSAPGFINVSYETACPHVYSVNCCWERVYGLQERERINNERLERLVEAPYVMPYPLQQPAMLVVVHALQIGTAEPSETTARRMAYFTSYFVPDAAARAEEDALWDVGEYHSYVCYPLDFQLNPWIASGRLFWLDLLDPMRSLRTGDTAAFPYPQRAPRRWWHVW